MRLPPRGEPLAPGFRLQVGGWLLAEAWILEPEAGVARRRGLSKSSACGSEYRAPPRLWRLAMTASRLSFALVAVLCATTGQAQEAAWFGQSLPDPIDASRPVIDVSS